MLDDLARWLFDPSGLIPHGSCLLWHPGLIWTNALSNLTIGVAYLTIPVALLVFARLRTDLAVKPLFGLFAAFILLCGAGHWLDLLTLWVPVYGVDGVVKAATAIVSLITAAAIWPAIRRARSLPSSAQFQAANAALRETNQRLQLASQIAGVGHWRVTLPSLSLWWSDEVFQIHGIDPACGAPSVDAAIAAYHPDDRATIALHVKRAIEEDVDYDVGARLIRPDGELRHVQARGLQERGPDGRVITLFGTFIDLTEQKRNEEALERLYALSIRAREDAEASSISSQRLARHLEAARDRAEQGNKAKSRFLANMSHELRTPLNGIIGYTQLLQLEGGLNATQSARLEAMMGAGNHLLQMINRVLDLSGIEAGRVELDQVDTDLSAVAEACLDLVRPTADIKRLELRLTIERDVPGRIRTDPVRLRQMLLNLLGNAVKFTARGHVDLRLASRDDGRTLLLEVADTGPGIPVERRHQLFQDFERLEASATSGIEGAGLGLAISARLAAMMGGRLGFRENDGGGSVFFLDLPEKDRKSWDASPPTAIAGPTVPAARAPAKPVRALVVDDVAMNRDVARAFLEAAGHEVLCANDGEAAIAAAAAMDFDVVLMDIRMPGMDGIAATSRIRRLDGPRGRVPIIAVTAQTFAEQIDECCRAGMDGHLAKPISPAILLETIACVIEAREFDCGNNPPVIASGHGTAPGDCGLAGHNQPERGVFDRSVFDRTTSFLAPAIVTSHIQGMSDQVGAIIRRLRVRGHDASGAAEIAEAAHVLAGSAGMFGFRRLAAAARRLECAARASAIDDGDAIASELLAGAAAAREAVSRRPWVPEHA